MPDLLTVGPDEIVRVWRDTVTHTFKGEPCIGAPFEKLFVMFHGARTVQIDIHKHAVRDGMPACVPGLIMLRDELNKILDEYTNRVPATPDIEPITRADASVLLRWIRVWCAEPGDRHLALTHGQVSGLLKIIDDLTSDAC